MEFKQIPDYSVHAFTIILLFYIYYIVQDEFIRNGSITRNS